MTEQELEHHHSQPATMADSVHEHTWAVGAERSNAAWLLSPYDTWERNPHYTGAPVPHPESEEDYEL